MDYTTRPLRHVGTIDELRHCWYDRVDGEAMLKNGSVTENGIANIALRNQQLYINNILITGDELRALAIILMNIREKDTPEPTDEELAELDAFLGND